jgi:hypothetical protein
LPHLIRKDSTFAVLGVGWGRSGAVLRAWGQDRAHSFSSGPAKTPPSWARPRRGERYRCWSRQGRGMTQVPPAASTSPTLPPMPGKSRGGSGRRHADDPAARGRRLARPAGTPGKSAPFASPGNLQQNNHESRVLRNWLNNFPCNLITARGAGVGLTRSDLPSGWPADCSSDSQQTQSACGELVSVS